MNRRRQFSYLCSLVQFAEQLTNTANFEEKITTTITTITLYFDPGFKPSDFQIH